LSIDGEDDWVAICFHDSCFLDMEIPKLPTNPLLGLLEFRFVFHDELTFSFV
jgi:hypothetical protein